MNRTLLSLALVAASGLAFAHDPASPGRDIDKVNGGITAQGGQAYGDLSTVNGGIRFGQRARIEGGLETVNGGIYVDRGGSVRRGVETVNGAIGLVDTECAPTSSAASMPPFTVSTSPTRAPRSRSMPPLTVLRSP